MFIFKLIKYNNTILNPFGVKFSPNKIYGLSIKGGRGGDPPIPYDKIFYWTVIFMVVMVAFWLSVVVVWWRSPW